MISIWTSPSGNGIKFLVLVASTLEDHRTCFNCLSSYFYEKYKIQVDKTGSDVSRLCYMSADENIIIKKESLVFDYTMYIFQDTKQQFKNKTAVIIPMKPLSKAKAFEDTFNRNYQKDRDTISSIIKYLSKNKFSITSTYEDWVRVALSISNTFTWGLGKKYFLQLCRLDEELHDEYKSEMILEYCYMNRRPFEVTFATIVYLARHKGFGGKRY